MALIREALRWMALTRYADTFAKLGYDDLQFLVEEVKKRVSTEHILTIDTKAGALACGPRGRYVGGLKRCLKPPLPPPPPRPGVARFLLPAEPFSSLVLVE